jgi:DNA mismatch repair protein MutS
MQSLTPAMQQYHRIKQQYKDCILMFRMGDFYEMFYDDAETASEVLDITLTKRTIRNTKIPLAGVPYHSVDPYIAKFVKKGYKLAICEQVEDPKLAKGVVKRDVVRIITPGTVLDSNSLDEKTNNYTMSIYCHGDKYGIAIADLSTGQFIATNAGSNEQLDNNLAMYAPSEILIPVSLLVNEQLIGRLRKTAFVNSLEDSSFDHQASLTSLREQLKVQNLEGFGLTDRLAINAAGALLSYLRDTQKNTLGFINKIRYLPISKYLILDETTLRNLEVTTNARTCTTKNTLLDVLDKSQTSMGSRLMRRWLQQPLLNLKVINARLDAVGELSNKTIIRKDIQSLLKKIADIERLISKISYGKCNARDLVALKNSVRILPLLKKELAKCSEKLIILLSKYDNLESAFELIDSAIKEEPSAIVTEGNMIRTGYNPELDQLRAVKSSGSGHISDLESKERAKTGIKSLRVKYNKVFGYFIEVTKANIALVPDSYIRKQTLVNSERFITEELKQHEEMILNAEERMIELEKQLFEDVVKQVSEKTGQIQDAARKIAAIDVLVSLAHVAVNNSYVKPEVDDKSSISLEMCRHPVLEKLEPEFIPNNCSLENYEMMLITGPNMAGKSTYMRQVALAVIMAQMGSYVPALKARIGIVDRIFTRVGAFDDLAQGQSTFMVEMTQTANILNNATNRSLVILDEIGRGTSTFDGVSLAWSVAEFIYKKLKCKTLFATHYHVLNKLADSFENIKNYNIAVKEDEDEVIFLRKIVAGGTDKSYGIHVAKLAGMPKEVIERAREIQQKLEAEDKIVRKLKAKKDMKQLSLTDISK